METYTPPVTPAFNPSEAYTLGERGGVVRASDGATIPPDERNADWRAFLAWKEGGGVPGRAPPPPFDESAVKAECGRRIYAVASQNCQMNMTAWIASGQAEDGDKAAFNAALGWVQSMRARCAELIAAGEAAFANDRRWPACPDIAATLAARF